MTPTPSSFESHITIEPVFDEQGKGELALGLREAG